MANSETAGAASPTPGERAEYAAPAIEEELEFETTALATCPKQLDNPALACQLQDSLS